MKFQSLQQIILLLNNSMCVCLSNFNLFLKTKTMRLLTLL